MEKLLEIKSQLLNKTVSYSDAFEQIKKLPKPWLTKHWKELRNEHLKDKCENCGSTEQPLVIQHTKQPRKFAVIYDEIMEKYASYEKTKAQLAKKYSAEKYIEKYLKENSEIRGTCPQCETISIRKNNKRNIYLCKHNHEFDTPVDVLYYTACRSKDREYAKERAISKMVYLNHSEMLSKLRAKNDEKVGREALLKSIEESIVYREFKNIKTCCKLCAAVEDKIIPKKFLCERCKVSYHTAYYKTCYNCSLELKYS